MALHDELVSARDQIEVVGVDKLLDDVGAEEVAGAARRETPALDVYGILESSAGTLQPAEACARISEPQLTVRI